MQSQKRTKTSTNTLSRKNYICSFQLKVQSNTNVGLKIKIIFNSFLCRGGGHSIVRRNKYSRMEYHNSRSVYSLFSFSDVRLVDGSTSREGRLEFLVNGTWGRVCDKRFGHKEASVACRQLGFPR